MPSTCEFQLNNPNAVYHSGDTVSGVIVLKTTSTKDVRDISIIFCGEGKVSWSETERRRKSDGTYTNHTVQFRSNELYVNNRTVVHGQGTLPAGTHTYTFQIVLPLQCPTSCEGRWGHIRYELRLKLDRPLHFDNEFSKPLSVIKTLDLNLNPVFRIPIQNEDIFSSGCCSCSGGSINTKLTVPFGGYAIGQSVRYSIYIQNQTMDDINGYSVEFIRKMSFTAHTPHHKTREDKTILQTKSYNKQCLRLTTCIFDGNINIVSTPPTTEGDGIIQVRYYLKVILKMSGCASDNTIKVPIFIGTIPLRESMTPIEPVESDRLIGFIPSAPALPIDDQRGNDLPPSYHELGPPSFEEATRSSSPFIDTDKNEHNRHIGFRPLYPSYSQIYYSGDTVSGTIILKTISPVVVKDICIIFRGEGKVNWSETERRRKSNGTYENRTVYFKSNELYVNNTTTLHGQGTLPAGTHTYTLNILLPLQCPTSCEGRWGHIRYEIKLKLNRPSDYDIDFSIPLSIIERIDLNLNPAFRIPMESDDIFSSCCWSCSGGSINTTLTIPFSGHAIGQTVKYSLYIKNQTMDDIYGYTIEFIRDITYTVRTPYYKTRLDKRILDTKSYSDQCLRLSTRIFEGNFNIGSTPPTTKNNSIIDVRYSLKIDLNIDNCSSDNIITMPIFIGTIPLIVATSDVMDNESFVGVISENDQRGKSDLPPGYQELGPPTFEEAIRCNSPFIDIDSNDHNRHVDFRPLYPLSIKCIVY
ncbi:Arrestin domain-containing protein 3 [Lucilia cuprina]|nr:Arrestin domain-containing protein 3 [Lucilia cuprina]